MRRLRGRRDDVDIQSFLENLHRLAVVDLTDSAGQRSSAVDAESTPEETDQPADGAPEPAR